MNQFADPQEATACCARFYEQNWVRTVLGNSFHPGGIELSARLIVSLGLPPDARVLDVACGVGTTALLMARRFGIDPVGLDASESNVAIARDRSADDPPVLVEFVCGRADTLPFPDGSFDAIVCECALSTFADQPAAVAEMARVLRPGGVIGLSDMVVENELPDDLAQWTCIAGAWSVAGYQRLFADAGFSYVRHDDESATLIALVGDLKRKLVVAGMSQAIGALPGFPLDLANLHDLLNRARAEAEAGRVRYARFIFAKGEPAHRLPAVCSLAIDCSTGSGCC